MYFVDVYYKVVSKYTSKTFLLRKSFYLFQMFVFILPVLPNQLSYRLTIALFYFLLYRYKFQYTSSKFKEDPLHYVWSHSLQN